MISRNGSTQAPSTPGTSFKNIILTNNQELKCKFDQKIFSYKITSKWIFVANVKWREDSGFGLLHPICKYDK